MKSCGDLISNIFYDYISELERDDVKRQSVQYVGSETLGEVIEKLIILNIRIWTLEDDAALAKKQGHIEEYAGLKTKLDFCFKVIRPRLVAALDGLLQGVDPDAVNFKHYKNE